MLIHKAGDRDDRSITRRPPGMRLATLAALLSCPVAAALAGTGYDENGAARGLFELSLEQLMDIEVISASKKPQRVSETAAAVFVITQEDIRRSGVKTIPDALRMSPGVAVAQIDSNKWAVSIRGFNGRFANKLLVMIDGRTIYSPAFSGVFWDVQDLMLDEIDRIEVIRGPGATLWGANAVNGVVNIITRNAADTQGGLVVAGAGNIEKGAGSIRFGGLLGDHASYRVYGKYFERGGFSDASSGQAVGDDWTMGRTGFRVDWNRSEREELVLQGSMYSGESGSSFTQPSLAPPFSQWAQGTDELSGGSIQARWNRGLAATASLQLQVFYDRTSRDGPLFVETRDTLDIETLNRLAPLPQHDLLWGVGYRYTRDDFDPTFSIEMTPASRATQVFSAFIQDEITRGKLRLTLGAKFEHNDYSGFEVQPNARFLWTLDDRQSLWGSIAGAVRTPARGDQDVNLRRVVAAVPAGIPPDTRPIPVVSSIFGSDEFRAEDLIAWELGYRLRPAGNLLLEMAAFYNDYNNLRTGRRGEPSCQPSGLTLDATTPCPPDAVEVRVPVPILNEGEGDTWGWELSADWSPRRWWRVQAAYSYLDMDIAPGTDSWNGENPGKQFSLRSGFQLSEDKTLDLWLRYVDELPRLDVPDYLQHDVRFAWRPKRELELSLVGRNLLQRRHVEFVSNIVELPRVEIERSFSAQIRWWF